MSKTPTASRPRFFASEVADAFADFIKASEEEREELFSVAISVGTQVANRGNPGRWDLFDPVDMLRCLDFLPAPERAEIAVRTMEMFHFLADVDALAIGRVKRISKTLCRASPAKRGLLRRMHRGFVDRCRLAS